MPFPAAAAPAAVEETQGTATELCGHEHLIRVLRLAVHRELDAARYPRTAPRRVLRALSRGPGRHAHARARRQRDRRRRGDGLRAGRAGIAELWVWGRGSHPRVLGARPR